MSDPIDPDQRAAQQLLAELRLRITVQSLPYQHGTEATALESLYKLFEVVRGIEKDHPGSHRFALLADRIMNRRIRAVTAKWHRPEALAWLASRDGGDAFRVDLERLRGQLEPEVRQLATMAGSPCGVRDTTPPVFLPEELDDLMAHVRAGIPNDAAHNGGMTSPGQPNADQRRLLDAINDAERRAILTRRRTPVADQDEKPVHVLDAFGLALSGGGIRSATLSLGVVQVLARRGVLTNVDYLSTVSGGGFCGSFVSSVFHDAKDKDGAIAELAAPHGPDPLPLQHVRRNARYLVGARLWQSWKMLVQTLLGMVFNWLAPLAAIGTATVIAIRWKRWLPDDSLWLWVGAGIGIVAMVTGIGFFAAERSQRITAAKWFGWLMAVAAAALLLAGGFGLLDAAFNTLLPGLNGGAWTLAQLEAAFERGPLHSVGSSTVLVPALLTSLLPFVLRFLPVLENPRWRKIVLRIGLYAAGAIVPLLGIAVAYVLFAFGAVISDEGFWGRWFQVPYTAYGLEPLVLGCALLWATVTLFLSINTTSPLRLYRQGLSRTFVERDEARTLALTDLAETNGPYHLLNATVNLPNSHRPVLRERSCDFFLFSPHFLGAPSIGYAPTSAWRCDGRRPDLATAMAISGAAFSANMGLGSVRPLRALMAFLNIRLGYWIRKPLQRRGTADVSSVHDGQGWFARLIRKALPTVDRYPGFLCLFYEMAGVCMHERRPWLNLSDGGHIENLALYELLRRRCKFVVAVDGEADPDHTFHGLLTLVRHAQIDLGVRIEPNLTELQPDPATGLCRSHFHLCRIRYPGEAAPGLLLYVKSSLTGNESALIQRYRARNPTFPHQTTLDQFFDEEQFEAYRQLGVHIGEGLFAPALTGLGANESVRDASDWFRRLAGNLLQPLDA
ncbi:MAG: hypothetical protein MUC36_21215 [Planctomycetes bacterium]|jgi:hypothetical protein|nr:hypothetical protein [Planctomycetota bacterium]